MTHVTCRLTAKNRDQLRNPAIEYELPFTFTFISAFKVRRQMSVAAAELLLRSGACTDLDRHAAAIDGTDRRTDGQRDIA